MKNRVRKVSNNCFFLNDKYLKYFYLENFANQRDENAFTIFTSKKNIIYNLYVKKFIN